MFQLETGICLARAVLCTASQAEARVALNEHCFSHETRGEEPTRPRSCWSPSGGQTWKASRDLPGRGGERCSCLVCFSQWPRDDSGPPETGGKLLRQQRNPKPLGSCCPSGSYSPDTARTNPEIGILYFEYFLVQCIEWVPSVTIFFFSPKWHTKSGNSHLSPTS